MLSETNCSSSIVMGQARSRRDASMTRGALRSSAIARITRDYPICISPTAKMPSTEDVLMSVIVTCESAISV
jgi:hypothetical protein